jgi:DNA-binding NtrC family response regulator
MKLQYVALTSDATISQLIPTLNDIGEWNVVVFAQPEQFLSARVAKLDFALVDEHAAGPGYLSLIKRLRRRFPAVELMAVGGPKSDEVRRNEYRAGVDYYYERPIDEPRLRAVAEHRMRIARLKSSVGIVGRSSGLTEIIEAILQIGPTEVPILLEGESGTGKDVLARAIHLASRRRDENYVAINCASLAEGVLESELFGHERGAFTGAVAQRAGVFERANHGTIFLDEVGEMSPNMQVRLLRVLESGEVLRVGGIKSFRVDVRVIAATNRILTRAVSDGTFRQDLYYRLKGVSFHVPALRERKEDIPLLVDYFIREANQRHKKDVKGIEPDALRLVEGNPWPGNIRELRNVIDTAVVLAPGGRITRDYIESQLRLTDTAAPSLLPVPLHRSKGEAEREMIYASILAVHRDVREVLAVLRQGLQGRPLEPMKEVYPEHPDEAGGIQNLAHLERAAIMEALRQTSGNRKQASEKLGISERTLYRKIKEYGLV